MHFNFIIYPDSKKILFASKIAQRFADRKEEDIPWFGSHISNFDVPVIIDSLVKNGFYSPLMSLPEGRPFLNKLEKAFQEIDSCNWLTMRNGNKVNEKIELDDLVMLAGWQASFFFKPEEIKNYKQFECGSLSEFTGIIGAFINTEERLDFRKGLKWTTTHPDGTVYVNEVSGSEHADLRIFQTNITPYKTTDPFGNRILYRPEMRIDGNCVAGYHSCESNLLASILRYVHHNGIDCDVFRDEGKKLIEWVKSFGQGGGTCAEHFFPTPDRFDSRMSLVAFDRPFPRLLQKEGNDYVQEGRVSDFIMTAYDSSYGIFSGQNKELIICYLGKEDSQLTVAAKFLPEEIGSLVKSLFYQAAKGLGRTSAAKLIDILEYRFSKDFEKDQKEFKT